MWVDPGTECVEASCSPARLRHPSAARDLIRYGSTELPRCTQQTPPAPHAAGLASWFSLVPIPGTMQLQMLLLAGGAFAAATAIERGARAAFPASLPPEKGGLVGRSGSRAGLRAKED